MRIILITLLIVSIAFVGSAQQKNLNNNPFKQLNQELPDPNRYRAASGAPGSEYWQQKVDYKIKMRLDDESQKLYGHETVTYINNSPDELTYLWIQLDQNVRSKDSDSHHIKTGELGKKLSTRALAALEPSFEGGVNIEEVKDKSGRNLKYMVNKTMMRIDLPKTLKPGGKTSFSIKWWYNINNTREIGGRSGYEHFKEDGNNVYCIAQFFPRLCKYTDQDGWQNKQFLGRGEFTLEFGDYDVEITVPSDHLVAATGTLQNESAVLTATQKKRLQEARENFVNTTVIATKGEADDRMKAKATNTKTWKFRADQVRDFAFATSRRFIWDAMNVKLPSGKTAMAMSMFVKEGDCLWSKYSTKAVAHALYWFSHYSCDYPYPVAWSIDGSMGMEYPMICFNYGRCEDDGTYGERMKYGHIGVIIHEVGHNFFPMIINSDERQWTWMDEGLTTFVQYLSEQQFERNYPSRRGEAQKITAYMGGDKSRISPIMTNSESIYQFGSNAYSKPATALNILRETIMGRDLFDYAFKEYSERWKFKSPSPSDFFRTMEDASGVDLDWFWRGWFYTNDHVDLALGSIKHFKVDPKDPTKQEEVARSDKARERRNISSIRNEEAIKQTYNERDPSLDDYYTNYDKLTKDAIDKAEYKKSVANMSKEDRVLSNNTKNYYEVEIKRVGGLVMPVILEFEYVDGTTEVFRIPAEIWKFGSDKVTKVFPTDKKVKSIVLDPFLETADIDTNNNYYPARQATSRFETFKSGPRQRGGRSGENPMQRANRAKKVIKS